MNVMTAPKIDASGVYDLTNEVYHGNCCVQPSVSASGIKNVVMTSPAEYWMTSALNPDAKKPEKKKIFDFGSSAHTLLLEPEKLMEEIKVIPQKVLTPSGAIGKDANAFIDDAEAAGKIALKPAEWKQLVDMKDVLEAHPYASRALRGGRPEVSVLMIDPETGLMVKTRPDFLPDASDQYIVDYKTTDDLYAWERKACVDLRYDIQATTSLWTANKVCGINPRGVLYLVQSKKPPYNVAMLVFTLSNPETRGLLDRARIQVRNALNTIKHCLDTNVWPTGFENPREIVTPYWHSRDVGRFLETTSYEFTDGYTI